VGKRVGDSVGYVVGNRDVGTAELGDALRGTSEGSHDGIAVGTAVFVGCAVGDIVGCSVG
jgi:hypothetical protein